MDNRRKIAVVCSGMGRVGSSALMGLFHIAGFQVGILKRPNRLNPSGNFESLSMAKFDEEVFGLYGSLIGGPPESVEQLERMIDKKIVRRFDQILLREFGDNNRPIAIKNIRFYHIPIYWKLRHRYDARFVILYRNVKDQAKSGMRMKGGDERTLRESIKCIRAWNHFGVKIVEKYDEFNYLKINFVNLIQSPIKTMSGIASFMGIPSVSDKKVKQWIKIKYVTQGRNKIL